MPKFSDHQVKEINSILSKIDKAVGDSKSKDLVVGAMDKTVLKSLLSANNIQPVALIFFECKREYSGEILRQVINKTGIQQSRFSSNLQKYIYLLAK